MSLDSGNMTHSSYKVPNDASTNLLMLSLLALTHKRDTAIHNNLALT